MSERDITASRGRIRITGFDADHVRNREQLSDWSESRGSETQSRWQRAWKRFKRNRAALIALGVIAFLSFLTIFARPVHIAGVEVQPFALAPYEPDKLVYFGEGSSSEVCVQDPNDDCSYYSPTAGEYWFGTDGQGRDVFSRILYGGRFSITIGFVVTAINLALGTVYGAISGYFGGWVDEVMMRIVDVIYAFPGLVLALVIVSLLGRGYFELVLAFTLFGWAGYARLLRGEVLRTKENEYVMAAKALGARDLSVIFRHVVPNAMAPVLVVATLSIGTTVIGVAALGFLGLGFPPGSAEWGTMLNGGRESLVPGPGQDPYWWVTVFPGMAIFIYVMAMNMIGDGINDALDAQETGVEGGGV